MMCGPVRNYENGNGKDIYIRKVENHGKNNAE